MWVLGLSGGYLHDAAACLFEDDRLVAFVEEERLSGVRYAEGQIPRLCVLACLREAGVVLADVDVVALSWNPFHPDRWRPERHRASAVERLFPRSTYGPCRAEVRAVDHQLAHAASAYRGSGYDEALVLSADGSGDGRSMAIYRGERGRLLELADAGITQSLGWLYQWTTTYLGLGSWQNGGKTMALAAFGEPRHRLDFLDVDDDAGYEFRWPAGAPQEHVRSVEMAKRVEWYAWQRDHIYASFARLGVPQRSAAGRRDDLTGALLYDPVEAAARDLAASVQRSVERALAALVRRHAREQGLRRLCLAGGVAMNCRAVGAILDDVPEIEQVYLTPVSGDMGGAFGAAVEVLAQAGCGPSFPLRHAYWGPAFSDDALHAYLRDLGYRPDRLAEPAGTAAELVAGGAVVGWFQGRMEVGARALGNRSILARPDSVELRDRVNRDVKNREPWRPFSPSVLAGEYLGRHWRHAANASPFMTAALPAAGDDPALAGVTHVDGTSRVQVVDPELNPRYGRLLEAIGARTGHPAVLNTSLNLRGQPIACRPVEALSVWALSAMDALVMGDSLLRRGDGP